MDSEDRKGSRRVLVYGAVISALLLAVFIVLQGVAPNLLQMPTQWSLIALVPVLVSVVAGGYVGSFKASATGIEFVAPDKRLKDLPEVAQSAPNAQARVEAPWQSQRSEEYKRTHGLFLVHIYTLSQEKGQKFDVFIYLVRHQGDSIVPIRAGLSDVEQVEFYFGKAWDHQIFKVGNSGDNILGVRAHAFGTFLATCHVTFRDEKRPPILLYRYVDCEMLAEKTA